MPKRLLFLINCLVILLVIVCCCCLGAFLLVGAATLYGPEEQTAWQITPWVFEGEWTLFATPTPAPPAALVRPEIAGTPIPVQTDMLRILSEVDIPARDRYGVAERLEGKTDLPRVVPPPPSPYAVGDTKDFWVLNSNTVEYSRVNATLQYVGEHIYFWVDDEAVYRDRDLVELAETFDQEIYARVRSTFGPERAPGVDGDSRLVILFTRGMGASVAGYFSASDAYPPAVVEYSNGHEMFFLSADNVELNENFTYGVLAHEFQHMIHWSWDMNEDGWLNEGLAEVAALLAGYNDGGFEDVYASAPDIPLTHWPSDDSSTYPYYGGSYLFFSYFLGRFGEGAISNLVAHPENGLPSIDAVLNEMGAARLPDDPRPGGLTAEDVFQDWAIASFVNDPEAGPAFAYPDLLTPPVFRPSEDVEDCPTGEQMRSVNQYGVDYIRITCPGTYQLTFEGSTAVGVVSAAYRPGSQFAFWSNRGNESNMMLTRAFDFSQAAAPLTLNYWAWYDLEEGYDYVYVLASTDGGASWDFLEPPSGVRPSQDSFNYGYAYNGRSGGWDKESIDLSAYAGQRVLIRFEYLTDEAVTGEGFLLDEVAVPEIGYYEDFENGEGGWEAAGFVRLENLLPQNFRLALIQAGASGAASQATYLLPEADNTLTTSFTVGGDVKAVTLVVSATTRFTSVPAAYQFEIAP